MLNLLTAAGVCCALLGQPDTPNGGVPLDDLAFLSGTWERREEDGVIREVWDQPIGDAIAGHLSWVSEGHAGLYELFVIERDEAGPVLRVRHFGHGLVPWESEAEGPITMPLSGLDGTRAVFEDSARSFPRQLVYTREGERLTAELLPAPDSDREPIIIEFSLVSAQEAEPTQRR